MHAHHSPHHLSAASRPSPPMIGSAGAPKPPRPRSHGFGPPLPPLQVPPCTTLCPPLCPNQLTYIPPTFSSSLPSSPPLQSLASPRYAVLPPPARAHPNAFIFSFNSFKRKVSGLRGSPSQGLSNEPKKPPPSPDRVPPLTLNPKP